MENLEKIRCKREILKRQGCLNHRSKDVSDRLFEGFEFFDPDDLVQVRYEMVRRVRVDRVALSTVATTFGVSRPTVYRAIGVFDAAGLAGLRPKPSGPHAAHKLDDEIVEFLRGAVAGNAALGPAELVGVLQERFGLEVHPRSILRALTRAKINSSSAESGEDVISSGTLAGYETMRRNVLSGAVGSVGHGLAILLHSGMPTWMAIFQSVSTDAPILAARPTNQAMIQGHRAQVVHMMADMTMRRCFGANHERRTPQN